MWLPNWISCLRKKFYRFFCYQKKSKIWISLKSNLIGFFLLLWKKLTGNGDKDELNECSIFSQNKKPISISHHETKVLKHRKPNLKAKYANSQNVKKTVTNSEINCIWPIFPKKNLPPKQHLPPKLLTNYNLIVCGSKTPWQ